MFVFKTTVYIFNAQSNLMVVEFDMPLTESNTKVDESMDRAEIFAIHKESIKKLI